MALFLLASVVSLIAAAHTYQAISPVNALVLIDQMSQNINDIFRCFESSLNITALSSNGADGASFDAVLDTSRHLLQGSQSTVIIGCLGSKLDHFFQYLVERFPVPFICAGSSISILDFQTQPVGLNQREPYTTIEEAIRLLIENSDAQNVNLLGTRTQINQVLPQLLSRHVWADLKGVLAVAPNDKNKTNINEIKKQSSKMILKIALDQSLLSDNTFTANASSNDCCTLRIRGVSPAHRLLGSALQLVKSAANRINASRNNQPIDTFVTALSLPPSPSTDDLFTWRASEEGLIVEKGSSRGRGEQIATISDGQLFMTTNYLTPNRKCRSPRALCAVVIEDDPGTFISAGEVTSENICYGRQCVKHIPTLTDNNMTFTRAATYCCTGYFIDIFDALEADLGFESEIYIVNDGKFGIYDYKKGKWNGLIAELIDGKADMVLNDLTVTAERQAVVDFADAHVLLAEYRIMFLTRQVQTSVRLFGFTDPFDTQLWVALFVTSILLVLILWGMDKYTHAKHPQSQDKSSFDFRTSFSYVWSSVFKIPLDDVTASSVGARFTYAVFSLGTLILMSSYTAKLMASLMVEEQKYPVNGIYDPKDPNSGFRFGTNGDSVLQTFLTNNSDPRLKKVGENAIFTSGPTDSIERLLAGELDAILDFSPRIEHWAAQKVGAFAVVTVSRCTTLATFAFPKRSRWKDRISHQLAEYRNTEFFSRLQRRWFKSLKDVIREEVPTQVTLMHMRGLFVILSSTIVCCLLVSVIQMCLASKLARLTMTRESTQDGGVDNHDNEPPTLHTGALTHNAEPHLRPEL